MAQLEQINKRKERPSIVTIDRMRRDIFEFLLETKNLGLLGIDTGEIKSSEEVQDEKIVWYTAIGEKFGQVNIYDEPASRGTVVTLELLNDKRALSSIEFMSALLGKKPKRLSYSYFANAKGSTRDRRNSDS